MRIKHLAGECLRRFFCLFPLDRNKVYFSSFNGRGYSDNCRAIAEALRASGEDLHLCWLVRTPRDAESLPPDVKPVYAGTLAQTYHSATAKFWVDNGRKYQSVKRRGQRYLQTWHGFALKRIEADAADALDDAYIRAAKKDSEMTDLYVSGSEFMTGLYHNSFWYGGEVAQWGTPRNDVFFAPTEGIARRVREALNLPADRKLALYAPTFRADGSTSAYGLDASAVGDACARRFGGEWSVLIRLHPNAAKLSEGLFAYDGDRVLDATLYPDMTDLLLAADLLITDYSSSMFDYALQGKPCMQFATDVEAYRNDRNFYFALDELPFPLAEDNARLCENIEGYSRETWAGKWKAFCDKYGFCEDGKAAARCANWILQQRKD